MQGDLDELNGGEEHVKKIEQGAAAIRSIVSSRMQMAKVKKSFKTTWGNLEDARLDAAIRGGELLPQHRINLQFLYADRIAERASAQADPELIKKALQQLHFAARTLASLPHLSIPEQHAAATMALLVAQQVRVPKNGRRIIEEKVLGWQQKGMQPNLGLVLESIDERRLRELVRVAGVAAKVLPPAPLPPVDAIDAPSTADLLAQAAQRQQDQAANTADLSPTYDLSEAHLKLISVKLSGFRGSPGETVLKFTQNNEPVSVVLFGENGVGKSTIVDAVEFALQARVGRSFNFDSPLTSAIRSFAVDPLPEVEVGLSDGRKIERTVVMNRAGILEAAPRSVSPGFRLAPVTLNRTNLQRLLDTESLERGSILLDYFPGDADDFAMRPEEEVHHLRGEMAELRIRRSSFAVQLGALLKVEPGHLAKSDQFNSIIRSEVMNGESDHDFKKRNGWLSVPEDVKRLIALLRRTHSALAAAKKRSQQTVEVFNPIVHRRQAGIISHVLTEVGDELSSAFNSIGHDYPVDRVDIVFGESGPLSLDFVVRLTNGRNCHPQQIFSEAYKDLLALLFFTSVAKKAADRGQVRLLILDDVLQSVDSSIRYNFVDYLLAEFKDWQFFITVHDRLWRDQLRDLFSAHEHKMTERAIHGWDFLGGPHLKSSNFDDLIVDLQTMLPIGQPRSIGALAGQLLETTCDRATRKLRIAVPRKDEDRYTLGELWPALARRLEGTTLDSKVRAIAAQKLIRNLTVHPDPRSWNLSQVDAEIFANSVIDLYRGLRCTQCGTWVTSSKRPSCSCGLCAL